MKLYIQRVYLIGQPVTGGELEDLLDESVEAGDKDQTMLCQRALAGDTTAREECQTAVDHARGRHDTPPANWWICDDRGRLVKGKTKEATLADWHRKFDAVKVESHVRYEGIATASAAAMTVAEFVSFSETIKERKARKEREA